jgi:hypothetical protein
MADNLKAIKDLENKYGLALFGMALTHMVDVGVRHLTDDDVEASIKHITAEHEKIKANGGHPIMSIDFQSGIIRCAAALAKFQIWDLFLYIKKHVHISSK